MAWDDYQPKEVRALHGIASRSSKPNPDLQKNLINLNQSVKYMSQMMGIMQSGIDDANKDIIQKIKDAIDDLIIIFGGGGDTLNFDWGDLKIIGENIGNILGFDFLKMPDINLGAWASDFFNTFFAPLAALGNKIDDAVHGLFEILFGWLDDVPFIGDFIRSIGEAINSTRDKAEDAIDQAEAVQGQVQTIQNLVFIRSGRPLWEGIDPTGEATFPFFGMLERTWGVSGAQSTGTAHTHSAGSIKNRVDYLCDSVNTRIGMIRHGYDGLRTQISFIGRRGSTGAIYLDLYKFKDDFTSEIIHSTGNLDASFSGNNRWVQVDIPDFNLALGDITIVQVRCTTGSYYITGADLFVPEVSALIPFRPLAIGGKRTASNAPATFTPAQADAWASDETPFFQLGSYDANINQPRRFFDNFNRAGGANNMGNNNYQFFSDGQGSQIALGTDGSKLVTHGGGQLLFANLGVQLIYPLSTLDFISEMDMSSLQSHENRRAGFWGHASSNATGRVEFLLSSDMCAITTRASMSASDVLRSSQTGMSNNNVRWKMSYLDSDKTYRLSKMVSGSYVEVITWHDPTNIAGRSDDKKYGGLNIWHFAFNSPQGIDNWDFRDAAYA